MYPLLINHNKAKSNVNAKSQQKRTTDAKSQQKRSDKADQENLFEIDSPFIESRGKLNKQV